MNPQTITFLIKCPDQKGIIAKLTSFFYEEKLYKGYTYVGDFLGYGIMEWKDGSRYNGYFKSGTHKKAGYGELIYDSTDKRKSYFGIW